MASVCLKISNEDRVGLVLDISDILCQQNINILSMEVHPNIIYLEVQPLDSNYALDLSSQLKTIPHVKEVETVVGLINSSSQQQKYQYQDNYCDNAFDSIVYQNSKMQRLIMLAKKAARTNATILLRGESGTGKELFASAIHYSSLRSHQPFIPINCAALPENLLESELFGYEDGSFTGAKKYGKSGLFEYANGGTLFLDEIGELPLSLQAKILRVLQEGKIKRIGSHQETHVDVRIIAATNCHLEEMIAKNQFREDLYYRLNVIPFELPSLRERKDDLPLLIESLLQKKCLQLGCEIKVITNSAKEKLLQHNWPGNIRELENVLERAICFSSKEIITIDDIFLDSVLSIANQTNNSLVHHQEKPKNLKELLNELECEILSQAIKKYSTSRQVGKMLGLSHTGVLNRIKKYNIC